jgi:hypothetical protein
VEPFEVLSLCAEVAVAIAGFSGVVLAFGDRARSVPGGADRVLFMTLFRGSLTPLAIIALAFVLNAAGLEPPTVWQVCSAAYAIAVGAILVFVRPQVARPDRVRIVTAGGILSLGLSLANLVAIQDFWPVLAVICWGLGVSLWAFVSLLGGSRAA